MLFELCELLNFITEGEIYVKYPSLREHNLTFLHMNEDMEYFLKEDPLMELPFHNREAKINNR